MAKLLISNFVINGAGQVGCHGAYQDTDTFKSVEIDGVPFDPTLSVSVRQQVLDGLVARANEVFPQIGLADKTPIIATDIEIIS